MNTNHSKTLLAIVVGLGVLSLIFKIDWLLYIGLILGGLALLSSFFEEKIAWGWSKIGQALGYINGNILLSIIFFIFLTPIALVMKYLAKKDNLQLKKPTNTAYYTRNYQFQKTDLDNIW